MALRDRGHRLAGYLTPPSDATEQEEEAASERVIVHCDTNRFECHRQDVSIFPKSFPLIFSDKISQTTVLRIEPPWENNSAPALIKTKELDHKPEPITRTDETKNVTSTNKVSWLIGDQGKSFGSFLFWSEQRGWSLSFKGICSLNCWRLDVVICKQTMKTVKIWTRSFLKAPISTSQALKSFLKSSQISKLTSNLIIWWVLWWLKVQKAYSINYQKRFSRN